MFGLFKKKKTIQHKEEKSTSISDLLRYGSGTNPKKEIKPEEMYCKASVAFCCVEKIASQALSFKYMALDKSGNKIENHPTLNLLLERSLLSGGQCILSSVIRNLLIYGEAYALKMPYGNENLRGPIAEFKSILPIDVGKNERNQNIITSYYVNYAGMSINIPVDQVNGYSDLLRISLYSSKNYNDGVSPMEAVGIEGRLIERVLNWNLSTLDKGLKPSGIISGDSGTTLTKEQQIQIMETMRTLYTGAENANNVVLLPNGMKLTTMQMNSVDMEFNTMIDKAMKNVALAFKVPLPLLFSDASTLDNYKMAIEEFIDQTVIPITQDVLETFNKWFTYTIGDGVRVVIDEDSIQGLEFKRERKGKRMIEFVKSGILTPNEARDKLGYDAYDDPLADSLFLPTNFAPIELLDGEPVIPNVKE